MIDKMSYDRSITMFSPDGRLLQVEYAKKTVKQGSTAIGIMCKDGVVLVADKRVASKLMIPESVEKVFDVDDHIVVTAAGIIPDARVLVDRAQVKSQQHRVTYDSAIDVLSVVKEICDLKQICTQSGGLRPFGVSLLIAGVEENGDAKLYLTEPYGLYFQYKAVVIGEGENEITEVLQKKYKASISVKEGVSLAVNSLKDFLQNDFGVERVDAVIVTKSGKKHLTSAEIKAHLK